MLQLPIFGAATWPRLNWNNVKDTVAPGEVLQPFAYYVDYVLEKFEPLTFP